MPGRPLTVVVPVKLFVPASTKMPAPLFTNVPVPVTAPELVWVAVFPKTKMLLP